MIRFSSSHAVAIAVSLLSASYVAAQTPAPTPAATPTVVPLDAIVAVVGDQPITRFDLREAVLGKVQRGEAKEPTDSIQAAALDSTVATVVGGNRDPLASRENDGLERPGANCWERRRTSR